MPSDDDCYVPVLVQRRVQDDVESYARLLEEQLPPGNVKTDPDLEDYPMKGDDDGW